MSGAAASSEQLALLVALVRAGAPPDARLPTPPPPYPISRADGSALVALAAEHGLSGLLYRSLQAIPHIELAPIQPTLQAAYHRTTITQLLAYQALGELVQWFGDASIPAIVLKGAALARTLYPDPALRPFGDLDLLVHEQDHSRAAELLRAHWYEAILEMSAGADSALWGQQTFVRKGTLPARVELHWHLFVAPYYRRRTRAEWFWNESEAVAIDGYVIRAFSPAAQILHLAAHSALHHSTTRYIWLYDLALLLAQHGDTVDWNKIGSAARSFGLGRALKTALRQATTVWGVPLPAQAHAIFAAAPPEPYERVVFALTRSSHKPARWIADGLSAGGARYFLAHLFPSPAYMRAQYHVQHDAALPLYYGKRLGIGAYKFVRAVLTLPFRS